MWPNLSSVFFPSLCVLFWLKSLMHSWPSCCFVLDNVVWQRSGGRPFPWFPSTLHSRAKFLHNTAPTLSLCLSLSDSGGKRGIIRELDLVCCTSVKDMNAHHSSDSGEQKTAGTTLQDSIMTVQRKLWWSMNLKKKKKFNNLISQINKRKSWIYLYFIPKYTHICF